MILVIAAAGCTNATVSTAEMPSREGRGRLWGGTITSRRSTLRYHVGYRVMETGRASRTLAVSAGLRASTRRVSTYLRTARDYTSMLGRYGRQPDRPPRLRDRAGGTAPVISPRRIAVNGKRHDRGDITLVARRLPDEDTNVTVGSGGGRSRHERCHVLQWERG
jgi:hypothetical protein